MPETLAYWNALDPDDAARAILPCCGSEAWAKEMAARRPFASVEEIVESSDWVWASLPRKDWLAAFDSHPRIGRSHAKATTQSLEWSVGEQSGAMSDEEVVKAELAEGNRVYEQKFHRIFIVCATGKSAAEMLAILNQRLQNDPDVEMLEAAEQQRQITQLRLRKWLPSE